MLSSRACSCSRCGSCGDTALKVQATASAQVEKCVSWFDGVACIKTLRHERSTLCAAGAKDYKVLLQNIAGPQSRGPSSKCPCLTILRKHALLRVFIHMWIPVLQPLLHLQLHLHLSHPQGGLTPHRHVGAQQLVARGLELADPHQLRLHAHLV